MGAFVRERVRRASAEEGHTRAECLNAHYRRWSFLSGHAPVSPEVFEVRFAKLTKLEPEVLHGHRVYAAEVVFEEKQDDESVQEEPKQPKVRGRVRITQGIDLRFDRLEVGEVVDWMEPTDYERKNLERLSNDATDGALSWLVIRFNGKRRYVRGVTVEKVYE